MTLSRVSSGTSCTTLVAAMSSSAGSPLKSRRVEARETARSIGHTCNRFKTRTTSLSSRPTRWAVYRGRWKRICRSVKTGTYESLGHWAVGSRLPFRQPLRACDEGNIAVPDDVSHYHIEKWSRHRQACNGTNRTASTACHGRETLSAVHADSSSVETLL